MVTLVMVTPALLNEMVPIGSVTVTLTVWVERLAPPVAVGLTVMVALSLSVSLSVAALTVTV